jgi:hypothetical protein
MAAMGHGHGEDDDHHGEQVARAGAGGHPHGGGGAAGGHGAGGGHPHSSKAAGDRHDGDHDKSLGGAMLARRGHGDHAAAGAGGAASGGAGHGHGSSASRGSSGSSGHSSHSGGSHARGGSGSSGSGRSNSGSGGHAGHDEGKKNSGGDAHAGHDEGKKNSGGDAHAGHDDGASGSGGETHAAHSDHAHVDGCDPDYRQHYELLGALGMRLIYQPGADGRNSAFRMCGPPPEEDITHEQAPGHCNGGPPTAGQQAFGDRLLSETKRALAKYKNNWELAIAEGFKPFVIPDGRYVHMDKQERVDDDTLFDADEIESFMFARVGDDWIPVAGMYMYDNKEDLNPPNPTGCLLVWHRHASYEGYLANATWTWDQDALAEKTVWMAHVWVHGNIDPWGRDYDGTEPSTWSWPSSMLPNGCDRKNYCPF